MTEGAAPSRRAVLVGSGALLALALTPRVGFATEPLERLLREFRKSPGLAARFTEEKYIALLKAPLTSEGALYFLPPHRLARHVERPKRSVLLLDEKNLRVADAEGTRSLDLSRNPALAALVQSFLHVLGGNRKALDENYRVEFEPGDSWRLGLVPRGAPLSRMVKRIELRGRELLVSSLVVEEVNGDRSVTRFSGVDAERRFSEAERKRFFVLPSQ